MYGHSPNMCGPGCFHGYGAFAPPAQEKRSITIDEVMQAEQYSDYMKDRWEKAEKAKKEKDKKPPHNMITVHEMWIYLIIGCLPMGWLLSTVLKYCYLGIQNNMQQLIAPH